MKSTGPSTGMAFSPGIGIRIRTIKVQLYNCIGIDITGIVTVLISITINSIIVMNSSSKATAKLRNGIGHYKLFFGCRFLQIPNALLQGFPAANPRHVPGTGMRMHTPGRYLRFQMYKGYAYPVPGAIVTCNVVQCIYY